MPDGDGVRARVRLALVGSGAPLQFARLNARTVSSSMRRSVERDCSVAFTNVGIECRN